MSTKRTRLLLLTRNPVPRGRFGPKEYQDWYLSLKQAVELLNRGLADGQDVKLIIPTAAKFNGWPSEAETYEQALREDFKVADQHFKIVARGYETIDQVRYGLSLVSDTCQVTFVFTTGHYPRVRWLTRHYPVKCRPTHRGIPRLREVATDLVLGCALPVLETLNLGEIVHRWTKNRRQKGYF